METKAGSQAGFTKETRSLKAAAPRTSPLLPGAPGLAVRHLSLPPIAHLWLSLPAPLSTRPNKGHPSMAASALRLHDFTTHSIPWWPRVLGETLSGLAGVGGLGSSGLWPGGWDPVVGRGARP